ncbi:non-specific lipid-transfer protein 13 [Argentina anserina]|uniref:non-specific lipid-transfer protein 13 n=1 Tax=Argentina anserina TaxID=57926 RepID=UPI00217659AF|nr:non-specific lipid-transfer protein 13 [Potentilla anserina]
MDVRPFSLAYGTLLVLVPVLLLCSTLVKAQSTMDLCSTVYEEFSLCLAFVANLDPFIRQDCCDAITRINSLARRERSAPRRICQCIKDISYWTGVRYNFLRISEIPYSCSLHLSFPISDSMDCSKI